MVKERESRHRRAEDQSLHTVRRKTILARTERGGLKWRRSSRSKKVHLREKRSIHNTKGGEGAHPKRKSIVHKGSEPNQAEGPPERVQAEGKDLRFR